MSRVTDFRIDTFEIAESDFYSLPAEVQQMIRTYSSPKKSGRNGVWRFEIPIYRWEEISAAMKRLKAGAA